MPIERAAWKLRLAASSMPALSSAAQSRSRGFGPTLGIGSTDIITTGLIAGNSGHRSWFAKININGVGGNGFGRVWDQSANSNINEFCYQDGTLLYFSQLFSSNSLTASIAMPATNVWKSLGVSYDNTSIVTWPIFYIDGATPTVTTNSVPAGIAVTSNDQLYIGNRLAADRNWDGMISGFAVWDTILSSGEFAALSAGASPSTIQSASLQGYWPLNGSGSIEPDLSGQGRDATVTGTLSQLGP